MIEVLTMAAEPFTSHDDADAPPEAEFRSGRRDWRRVWDKADALDPERWKAMASAVSSLWQEAAKKASSEQGPGTATKTCPYCAEEIKQAAIKCKHCSTWLVPAPEQARYNDNSCQGEFDRSVRKGSPLPRLTRSTKDATLAGVLSGLGHFLGLDPTWLRIAYALGTVFTAIVPGIAAYAILALVIPADNADQHPGTE
jgi:phage shock protein PspC (stress-responsive transcriptional regulator)